MGGIVSRISPDITFDHGLNESYNRLKNSFDRTPKYKIIDDKLVDPRSATLEINRTPLCLLDLADESDLGTPVVRNRKKSRRSASRLFEVESSVSEGSSNIFEFSAGSPESSDDCLAPADSNDDSTPPPSEKKYEVVVEELRRCLGKVSMTPVYVDDEPVDGSRIIQTPPNKKDLKKQHFWTPDINSQPPLSPMNKERTPLGLVNSNMASSRLNSPAMWRGGKMWRGPADERAKLQGENTPPPSLPPFGSPCSAPPTNRYLHYPINKFK